MQNPRKENISPGFNKVIEKNARAPTNGQKASRAQ